MNITKFETQETMTLKEITDLLEVRHNDAMSTVGIMLKDQSFGLATKIQYPIITGKGREQMIATYQLNKRQSIAVASRLNTALLMRIIDRWEELEREAKEDKPALPNFSDPVAAAQAWIEQYKATQLAIATKAEIGSRREATSMNTASQAVKKATALEVELDKSKGYATIKRMTMKYHGTPFSWKRLKDACNDLEIDSIKVFDQNYGQVRAYPAEAWMEAYAIDINE